MMNDFLLTIDQNAVMFMKNHQPEFWSQKLSYQFNYDKLQFDLHIQKIGPKLVFFMNHNGNTYYHFQAYLLALH